MTKHKHEWTRTRHEGIKRCEACGAWQLRATKVDPKTGRRRDRNVTFSGSEGQALDAWKELRDDLSGPAVLRSGTQTPTFNDYCERWLRIRSRSVTAHTARSYARALAMACASFGALRLDQIQRADLEEFIAQQAEGYHAPRSQTLQLRIVLSALRDGCADYHCADPTQRLKRPKQAKALQAGRALTMDELRALLLSAREAPPEHYAYITTLALTGMRPVELRRLRREDLDLARGWLRVRQSKTEAGERDVPLPMAAREALSTWLALAPPGGELVFGKASSKVRAGSWSERAFHKVADAAGVLGVQLYDLRRTWVTMLRRSQVDQVVRMALVGHADAEVHRVYDRPDQEDKRRVVEELARQLEGGEGEGRVGG